MGDEFLDSITLDKLTKGEIEDAAKRAHGEAVLARGQHRIRVQAAEALTSKAAKRRHLDVADLMNRRARIFETLSEVAYAYAIGELVRAQVRGEQE